MRVATLLIAVIAGSATASAQDAQTAPEGSPLVLFGGRYSAPTRWTGDVAMLFRLGKPRQNGDLGDLQEHRGLEVEASAGVGGARLALGPAFVGKPPGGPALFGADLLVGLTRTWNSPRGASTRSSYAGLEGGLTLLMVRLSAGIAHRVAGTEGPDANIFTWSVGVRTGW